MTAETAKNHKYRNGILIGIALALVVVWLGYSFIGLKLVPASSSTIAFSAYPEPAAMPPGLLSQKPKNIIVFIADGMGFSHMSLSMLTRADSEKPDIWQQFAVRGWHDPRSHFGSITDSAASSTALSTGELTHNGRIGVDENGERLTTLFELAWDSDYRTGIVTDSYIWDATPAGFVAHSDSRDNAEDILRQLAAGDLEILFGELEDVGEDEVPEWEETIDILNSRFQMLDENLTVPDGAQPGTPLAAVFPEDSIINEQSQPNLNSMIQLALTRLSDSQAPFLLMVESEEMDSASHRNDSERAVTGMRTIENAVQTVLSFARRRGDTLVVFTSDHETGGLAVSYDENDYPNLQLIWASENHTAAVVPLFADGPGADSFADVRRVWQVGERLKMLINPDLSP